MRSLFVLEQVMTQTCLCLPSMRCNSDPPKAPQSASCLLSMRCNTLSSDPIDHPAVCLALSVLLAPCC